MGCQTLENIFSLLAIWYSEPLHMHHTPQIPQSRMKYWTPASQQRNMMSGLQIKDRQMASILECSGFVLIAAE